MSTQAENGIEFSIIPEESQQHFRLLELPPDLLELVASNHPPLLQLKSTEGPHGDSSAVLCTPDKTYNLRQVSTSNTVFIANSVTLSDDHQGFPRSGLEAIAQLQSTLELLSTKDVSAVPFITAALPAYTSTGHYSSKDAVTKSELFDNIPLSAAECETAWRSLACFELGEERHCVVPSASVKLKVWEYLLAAATAMGIDLTQPLDQRRQSTVIEMESDWPDDLSTAVLRSLAVVSTESNEIQLDDQICAKNIGRILLKDRTDGVKGSISTPAFKSAWADLLPEKWRSLAELSLLDGWYNVDSDSQGITYVDNSIGITTAMNGATGEMKSTLGAKRKWHEKFRVSKKSS